MVTRLAAITATVTLATGLLVGGCGSDDSDSDGTAETGAGSELPQGSEPVDLDPADFTTKIDNPYWPMEPGTRWVYSETDEDGKHRIVVTVTDKTKEIANGIEARVVRDVVSNGEPIEITDDWYAQDSAGNVWYLGEKTAEYEHGKLVTRAGSFEAGVDGAQPGIIMPAEPEVGQTYRQEYYEGKAEDEGKVVSLDQQAEVPAGHYPHTLLINDLNPLEPKVSELKFYEKGVGPVLAVSVSGEAGDREELIAFHKPGG
jgi:hypothetical protein